MTEYYYSCDTNFKCSPQSLVLPPGRYLIECYGAQGGVGLRDGKRTLHGGKGAYTSGILTVKTRLQLFLYIGGQGEDARLDDSKPTIHSGWNGGGNGEYDKDVGDPSGFDHSAAGGGATDIRLIGGDFDNDASLKSRIMVAAGGSGSAYLTYGSPGGDIQSYFMENYSSYDHYVSFTNQTHGHALGIGENGRDLETVPYSGAGGGYFGGTTNNFTTAHNHGYRAVSSGGSSYVSGYKDCIAMSENGEPLKDSIHMSGIFFQKPKILNGFQTFPGIGGKETETGHEGNGAIRITQLSICTFERKYHIHSSLFVYVLINFS